MDSTRADPRRRLGADGEAHASEFLRRAGYRIVCRNVRAGGVEIDLVARRGRVLAFVEVKTRSSGRFGGALAALSARQQRRLVEGAAAWLRDHPQRGARIRFDLVAVEHRADGEMFVRHVPGAFDAGDG